VNELVKKSSVEPQQKRRFQRLMGSVRKVTNFLSRRHIWSGLLAGFLWAFSAPFVLTSFPNFSEETMWIFFFPLKLSLHSTQWISDLQLVDPYSYILILLTLSIFVGMLMGVILTYGIHRIRVWRLARNKFSAV